MWSVGSSLGRAFLVAGFLPTIVFIVATDYVAASLWLDGQSLLNRNYQGIEDLNYLLVAVLGAFLLLALNRAIIRFYAQGPFLLRRLLLRQKQKQYRENFTALCSRQEAFQQALWRQEALAEAIGKLEGTYDALEKQTAWQYLPADVSLLKPTDLGNVLARMESYPGRRYGMDGNLYWPRLTAVIPENYKSQMGELKTTLDFMVNASLLAALFAGFSLIAGIWESINSIRGSSATAVLLGLLALVITYSFYRIGVNVAQELSQNVASCFDLFRWELLGKYGADRPGSLIAERQLWQTLARFINRGELFYFPTTLTNEDEAAALQQALVHHAYYLHQLRLLSEAGNAPDYLKAQITFAGKRMEAVQEELKRVNG